jgi:phosphoenolpyruvate carboxylase
MKNYSGVRTVTIQSAFRYDYPRSLVIRAIKRLGRELPRAKPVLFSPDEIREISDISELFASYYRPVVTRLASQINDFARFIPSHRERIPHTGHFGYSRKVGKKTHLPRAIAFTAIFTSLGVPPSLIGTGRALKEFLKNGGTKKTLYRYLPTFEEDLITAGSYLNWENLKFLAQSGTAWDLIRQDVIFLEKFLGKRLGPSRPSHFIHRNLTSSIYQLWTLWRRGNKKSKTQLKEEILRAARVRRSLG